MAKRFRGYRGRVRADGLPDRRTREGKRAWSRSEAAKRGAETRKARKEEPLPGDYFETEEYIVEEPIETVGGKRYRKKGR